MDIAQVEPPRAGKVEDRAKPVEFRVHNLKHEALLLFGAGRWRWCWRGGVLRVKGREKANTLQLGHLGKDPDRSLRPHVEVGKDDAAASNERPQANAYFQMRDIEHDCALGILDDQSLDHHGRGPVGHQVVEQTWLPGNGSKVQRSLHFGQNAVHDFGQQFALDEKNRPQQNDPHKGEQAGQDVGHDLGYLSS